MRRVHRRVELASKPGRTNCALFLEGGRYFAERCPEGPARTRIEVERQSHGAGDVVDERHALASPQESNAGYPGRLLSLVGHPKDLHRLADLGSGRKEAVDRPHLELRALLPVKEEQIVDRENEARESYEGGLECGDIGGREDAAVAHSAFGSSYLRAASRLRVEAPGPCPMAGSFFLQMTRPLMHFALKPRSPSPRC